VCNHLYLYPYLLLGNGHRNLLRPLPDQLLQLEHDPLALLHGYFPPGLESLLCGPDGGFELFVNVYVCECVYENN
jgi:hypothetical protein